MSYAFKSALVNKLHQRTAEHTFQLASRTTDDLGALRLQQGIIIGLQMAEIAAEEVLKEYG
jgi:hypothetical protein